MNLELNAIQALLGVALLFSFLLAAIFFLKKSVKGLPISSEYRFNHRWTRFRSLSLKVGFLSALALAVMAFSFTRFATPGQGADGAYLPLEEIEVKEIPRTAQQKKKPPKPIPTKVEIVPEDVPVETVVFEPAEPDEPMAAPTPPRPAPKILTPPPRPKSPESDSVHIIVEVPPMFPGCEEISDREERKKCADEALLHFIQQRLTYPATAREIGIEGLVVIRFVVEKDGAVTGIRVLRDPGGGLGAEAVRVVQSMPKWNPGIQGGRRVRVQFTLPVRFKLQ